MLFRLQSFVIDNNAISMIIDIDIDIYSDIINL